MLRKFYDVYFVFSLLISWGDTRVFGWVCAAQNSKIGSHFKKNLPLNWYPILKKGQFLYLILESV